jgi:DNA-binding MarR family transcriptional regulator
VNCQKPGPANLESINAFIHLNWLKSQKLKKNRLKIEEEIKQRKFNSSHQKVVLNILFTANWMQDRMKEYLKPYGLTSQQYNVLRILRGRHPGCAYPTEIKSVMLDKNPDLTRLCDRLINGKWISREIDNDNRRKMKIAITEEGLELLTKLDPVMKEIEEKMNLLNEEDSELLSGLLDKMRG